MSDGARDDDIASDRPRPPARPARCIQSHRGRAPRWQLPARAPPRSTGPPRRARALGSATTPDGAAGRRREDLAAVLCGCHMDTVGTGGRYDGLYGVLAGLEACEALNDAGRATRRPLALVAFTNEEGSRFAPYAMGSLVYVGGLALED